MFSFKNKLDVNLKAAIDAKSFKSYRVLISCKNLRENIENKIRSFKGELIRSIPSINCICANLSSKGIERLLEYPDISFISFDSSAVLCGSSILSANGISFQERYKLTGKGIGIGLVDSGVYPHPDLLHPNSKIKYFLDLVNGYKYPYDDNGHGTFMSGIICGSGYSSKGMYRGIAENSHIYAVKAFNSAGKAFISDILFSIDTIIENSKDYNIRIICLPFELLDQNKFIVSLFSKIYDKALSNNMVVVVPSGHNGTKESSMRGIATLPNCITIGGLDTKGSIKNYILSSCGPCGKLEKPDLAAACVDICSLNSNKDYISERNGMKVYTQPLESPYTNYTGTSCAAAYISGVCSLLFENNPELSFKDLLSLLKVSCKLIDSYKWSQGAGMLELGKLLP